MILNVYESMSYVLRKILIYLKIATWVSYINLSGELNKAANLFLCEVNNCPLKWHGFVPSISQP